MKKTISRISLLILVLLSLFLTFKASTLKTKADEVSHEITKIQFRTAGSDYFLFLIVDNSDYNTANKLSEGDAARTLLEGTNVLEYVTVYSYKASYLLKDVWDGVIYTHLWGESNSICFRLKKDMIATPTGAGATIKAGTTLPSEDGSGKFTVTETRTFVATSVTGADKVVSNYSKGYATTMVSVPKVHLRSTSAELTDNRFLLFLEGSDIVEEQKQINQVNSSEYFKYFITNMYDHVLFYVDGEEKWITLGSALEADFEQHPWSAVIDLWGEKGCYSFKLKAEYNGGSISKIKFLEGCEFPSFANLSQATASGTTEWSSLVIDHQTEFACTNQANPAFCTSYSRNIEHYVDFGFADSTKDFRNFYKEGTILNLQEVSNTIDDSKCKTIYKNGSNEVTSLTVDSDYQIDITYLEHAMEDVELVEPTKVDAGHTAGSKCKNCDYSVGVEILPATGLTYSDKWSYDSTSHYHQAVDEGYEDRKADVESHDFVYVVDKEALENVSGERHQRCSICLYDKENSTEVIPALPCNHNMTEHERIDATCIEEGCLKFYSCDKCNKLFKDADGNDETALSELRISKISHNIVDYKCTMCGLEDKGVRTTILKEVKEDLNYYCHVRSAGSDTYIIVFIKDNDYGNDSSRLIPAENLEKLGKYNFLDNVTVETKDGVYALKDIIDSSNIIYFNIWGEYGSLAIKVDGSKIDGSNVKLIKTENDTSFPSYGYVMNSSELINPLIVDEQVLINSNYDNEASMAFSISFTKEYLVKFDGEMTYSSQSKAVKPTDPIKNGFIFDGWYLGDTKYDFNQELTSSISLESKWIEEVELTIIVNGSDTKITQKMPMGVEVDLGDYDSKIKALFGEDDCGYRIENSSSVITISEPTTINVTIYKHDFLSYEDLVVASCSGEGERKHTCEICSKYYIESLPKLDHVLTKHDAVDATCEKRGHGEYYECTKCSKLFSNSSCDEEVQLIDIEINKLGHDFKEGEKTCSRCDQINPDYIEVKTDEKKGGCKSMSMPSFAILVIPMLFCLFKRRKEK